MLSPVEDVKERLGITEDSLDDFLEAQIQLISDVIEAYCRRKFAAATWIQTFYREDIRSASQMELYHFPIITLTSIDIDEVAVDLDTLRIHKPSAILRRSVDAPALLGDEIIVEYEAGYETIPSPILAVLDALVGERYNKKRSGVDLSFGADIQRVSIPGAISIDFDYSLANNDRKSAYGTIIGNHANVLDDWRSERSVIGSGKLEYVEEEETP